MLSLGNNITSSSSGSRELIVNGSFSIASGDGVGWIAGTSVTTTGGVGTIPNTGGTLHQNILTSGKTYNFRLTALSPEGGQIKLINNNSIFFTFNNTPLNPPGTIFTVTGTFTAAAVDFTIGELGGGSLVVDDVSVTEA